MAVIWPFPRELISGVYPGSESYFGHSGIDWPGARVGNGSPILAVADGTVLSRTVNSANDPDNFAEPWWRGNSVTIGHGTYDGIAISSLSAHMLDAPLVNVGDTIVAGQIIGYLGNSGASSGAHLHLEIIYNGSRLPTDTPGNNYPGLGYERTLAWLDTHAGATPDPPDPPGPGRRSNRRRNTVWMNRPPGTYYRNW